MKCVHQAEICQGLSASGAVVVAVVGDNLNDIKPDIKSITLSCTCLLKIPNFKGFDADKYEAGFILKSDTEAESPNVHFLDPPLKMDKLLFTTVLLYNLHILCNIKIT